MESSSLDLWKGHVKMDSTVLVVDDDPDTTKLVGLYLGRDGHKSFLLGMASLA